MVVSTSDGDTWCCLLMATTSGKPCGCPDVLSWVAGSRWRARRPPAAKSRDFSHPAETASRERYLAYNPRNGQQGGPGDLSCICPQNFLRFLVDAKTRHDISPTLRANPRNVVTFSQDVASSKWRHCCCFATCRQNVPEMLSLRPSGRLLF